MFLNISVFYWDSINNDIKHSEIVILLSMGVSICLDVISISMPKKGQSRQFQKVSLDDRDIWIEMEKSRFCLDINVQTKKSQSRSRNSSRSENFGASRQFVSISIEKCQKVSIKIEKFVEI
jgi:hypothetical protein